MSEQRRPRVECVDEMQADPSRMTQPPHTLTNSSQLNTCAVCALT